MSTIASHSPLNILETVRDRGLVPKDHHHWKWPTGNQMVTWLMTSHDPERSNSTPIRLERNILKTAGVAIYQQINNC